MAQGEDLGEIAGGDQTGAGLRPPCEHLQIGVGGDVLLVHAGETRMRLQADLVKAVGQEAVLILQILREHAEDLLRIVLLAHMVAVVQRAHGAPAQIHGGEHVGGGPIEDLLELVPIIDLFEGQVLDRRARHHKAVVVVVLERVEGLIELEQMVRAHVRRLMRGGLHEIDLHLQRAFRDEAQQLRLRLDLLRHEIQDHQLERAHALALRFGLFKREDTLGVENVSGRKATGNLDRHIPIMVRGRIWRVPVRSDDLAFAIRKIDGAS